jgi:hypothetical protein
MDTERMQAEKKRIQALRRLGCDNPVCIHCGEDDWRCLELHHVARRANDDLTAIVCRNCHRKVSDASDNGSADLNPPILERVGQLLMGLAEFLIALANTLLRYGNELLNGVAVCPAPWGLGCPVEI